MLSTVSSRSFEANNESREGDVKVLFARSPIWRLMPGESFCVTSVLFHLLEFSIEINATGNTYFWKRKIVKKVLNDVYLTFMTPKRRQLKLI